MGYYYHLLLSCTVGLNSRLNSLQALARCTDGGTLRASSTVQDGSFTNPWPFRGLTAKALAAVALAGKTRTVLEHVWLERARVPAGLQPLRLLFRPGLGRRGWRGAGQRQGRSAADEPEEAGTPPPVARAPRERPTPPAGLCRCPRPLAPRPGRGNAAPAATLPRPPPARRPRVAAPALPATDAVRAAPAPTWRQRGAEQRGATRAASG